MGLRGPCQKEMANDRQPQPTVPQMGSKRMASKCLVMPKPSDSSFTGSAKSKGRDWRTGALIVMKYLIVILKPNTNFSSSFLLLNFVCYACVRTQVCTSVLTCADV